MSGLCKLVNCVRVRLLWAAAREHATIPPILSRTMTFAFGNLLRTESTVYLASASDSAISTSCWAVASVVAEHDTETMREVEGKPIRLVVHNLSTPAFEST